jgi:HSP20 family protein
MWLRVDVYEEADEIVLEAEAPGRTREDLWVRATGASVRIAGAADEPPGRERRYHRRERRSGTLCREVPLPAAVDPGRGRAWLSRGVLRVRLPRVAACKTACAEVTLLEPLTRPEVCENA